MRYKYVKARPGAVIPNPSEPDATPLRAGEWIKVAWPGPGGYWTRRAAKGVIEVSTNIPVAKKGGK